MADQYGPYRYFLTARTGRAPAWIRAAQWALFALWLAFSWWILFGRGMRGLQAAFYGFHGLYATEVAMRASVLPNWGLITLALGALAAWLQALWWRCRWSVSRRGDGWAWEERRGPERVLRACPTAGGSWISDGRRWAYIPRGLVDGAGNEWLSVVGGEAERVRGLLTVGSPLLLFLLVLLAGAWLLQRPVRAYRSERIEVTRAVLSDDSAGTDRLLRIHPEFRPWARYVATLKACDRASCMGRVIRDRLEVHSIGPAYSGDEATLARLLIVTGRTELLLRLGIGGPAAAFDAAVRSGDLGAARAILARDPGAERRRAGMPHLLFLLQEGKLEEAYRLSASSQNGGNPRALELSAALAKLTGRPEAAARAARRLLSPETLDMARLDGPGPATGLGTLQRIAQQVVANSTAAVAHVILGDPAAARRAWGESRRMAIEGGVTGLIQVDAILLSRLDPGGPWAPQGTAR